MKKYIFCEVMVSEKYMNGNDKKKKYSFTIFLIFSVPLFSSLSSSFLTSHSLPPSFPFQCLIQLCLQKSKELNQSSQNTSRNGSDGYVNVWYQHRIQK